MQGETIVIKPVHQKLATRILELSGVSGKKRPVLAISGASGSGKTTLAYALCILLKDKGFNTKLVQTDNFYLTLPSQRTQTRLLEGVEHSVGPQEYDWTAIGNVIRTYKKKLPCAMPVVDLFTGQVDTLFTDFQDVDILILEGLYAIGLQHAAIRIFLETDWETTLQAQRTRKKEKADALRIQILQKENEAVARLTNKADLVIQNFRIVKPARTP